MFLRNIRKFSDLSNDSVLLYFCNPSYKINFVPKQLIAGWFNFHLLFYTVCFRDLAKLNLPMVVRF